MDFRKSKEHMGNALIKRSQVPIALVLILAGTNSNYLRTETHRQEWGANVFQEC